MMFAALALERAPLQLADVPQGFINWVQDAGGFAIAWIWLFLIVRQLSGNRDTGGGIQVPSYIWKLFRFCLIASMVGYLVWAGALIPDLIASAQAEDPENVEIHPVFRIVQAWALTVAGAFALLAVLLPFLHNLVQLRWRRIWGLARLSFKEAVRRKILYVFSAMLFVFLFLNWFVPHKPEDQVRNYVSVVFWAMTPLVLVSAGLVSAFSIPNDIKNQAIHTIVTKPVERFEVVLGRFLGYVLLMTLMLFAMTAISVLYVMRTVTPEAAEESLKARVPLYGELHFEEGEKGDRIKGESVGREWDYREYISGGDPTRPATVFRYAVWSFPDVPRDLGERDFVLTEFNFDIYRTTKGKEGEGINCTFIFETWQMPIGEQDRRQRYKNALQERKLVDGTFDPTVEPLLKGFNELTEEYGYYEIPNKNVEDFHTLFVQVPAGLIRNHWVSQDQLRQAIADLEQKAGELKSQTDALGKNADRKQEREKLERDHELLKKRLEDRKDSLKKLQEWEKEGKPRPPLRVRVRCEDRTQYVGMARYDLYFREDDPSAGSDKLAFALNFFKGAMGLWFRMCLLVGLCVALSTELGGIISFLCAGFLYMGGLFRDFIQSLAAGKTAGGGPLESFFRLVGRKNLAAPLEETTATRVAQGSDTVFSWMLRRLLNVLPDIERFDFTDRVANGFNVGVIGQDLLPSFLLLVGYLLPWAVLAFYLIKSREIAGAH